MAMKAIKPRVKKGTAGTVPFFLNNWVCQVNCVSFFENCNLVGATPTKLKKAARSVKVI